jgi:molecular chaperone DnaK
MSNVESAIKGDDKKAIDAAVKALSEAALELGKIAYESSKDPAGQAGAQGAAGSKSGGKPDDVIDAEYEVKDGN